MQQKIYATKRDYSYYLRCPNPNTFCTSPTSLDKVKNVIHDLKTTKGSGPNRLPHKILKQINVLSTF